MVLLYIYDPQQMAKASNYSGFMPCTNSVLIAVPNFIMGCSPNCNAMRVDHEFPSLRPIARMNDNKRLASEVDGPPSATENKRVCSDKRSISRILGNILAEFRRRENEKKKSFTKWSEGGTSLPYSSDDVDYS